jgi:hypothetical protein
MTTMRLLFNRFTILIFASAVIFALVLGLVFSTVLTRTFSWWERENIAAVLRHHVLVADLDVLFTAPLDATNWTRWAEAVPDLVESLSGVTQCKIWDRRGRLLWSEDEAAIGQESPANPSLRSALNGTVVAELKELVPTEQVDEFKWLMDVYVPILSNEGRVTGVVEIYTEPTLLLTSARWGLVSIWAVSIGGAALLSLAVLPLVKRVASRPAPARARAANEIVADVEQRFGFCPPFFEPAMDTPSVLENLWQQTISAYVDNPLPALFKERLFAYLSRYCAVPYCIVCHSCALRPLGMTAAEVLALLESPPPTDADIARELAALVDERAALAAWPDPGSPLEVTLMNCSIHLFVHGNETEACQAEMRRLLGPVLYARLIEFLAYVSTCLLWVETHPELAYEADKRAQDHLGALLDQEPGLLDFFRSYAGRVKRERRRRESAGG